MEDDVTMERNEQLRRMVRDLGRTLAEAISDSSDASRTLRRLHNEGYAISLALGRSRDGEPEETLTVLLEKRLHELRRRSPGAEASEAPPGVPPEPGRESDSREPQFRMRGRDLAFLRSIGIDPTRSAKRRRR
jgi:hypothetical protein